FFFQAEDGIRDRNVTGVQTCALPIFAILLGVNAVEVAVNAVPDWVMDSLTLAGGILPALGFAMLFNMMSNKKLIAYFIIGFALRSEERRVGKEFRCWWYKDS